MDGQVDEWMSGWMGGWIDPIANSQSVYTQ